MYVPLDVNFPDDDKIEQAGLAGAGLYAMALCIAKRTMSDGRVTTVKLRRLGADDALVSELVRLDLFRTRPDDPGAVWITAFLAHNDDAATIERKRSSDAQRKRATRRKRPGGLRADGADASENVQCLEVEVEVETEGEVEVEVDPLISGQPQLLADASERTEIDEQRVNESVALFARAAAERNNADDPAAYASSVGRSVTESERDLIRGCLATGGDPAEAAAKLTEHRGSRRPMAPAVDPAAAAVATERAKRAEEATRERLAKAAAAEVGNGRSGAAAARAALRPSSDPAPVLSLVGRDDDREGATA